MTIRAQIPASDPVVASAGRTDVRAPRPILRCKACGERPWSSQNRELLCESCWEKQLDYARDAEQESRS